MRSGTLLFVFALMLASSVFAQTEAEKWTTEFGFSKNTSYPNFKAVNLRFISPAFELTTQEHYWTAEEEKHPEKFKKTRMLVEFIFAPPFSLPKEKNSSISKVRIPGLPRFTKTKFDSSFYYVSNNLKLSELSASLNFQYRVMQYKRLSVEAILGFKFFFLMVPQNGLLNFNKLFYLNLGLLTQLDLGMFLPFADIGFDRIYTIGLELKLHSLFRKAGKRYKLHLKNK